MVCFTFQLFCFRFDLPNAPVCLLCPAPPCGMGNRELQSDEVFKGNSGPGGGGCVEKVGAVDTICAGEGGSIVGEEMFEGSWEHSWRNL